MRKSLNVNSFLLNIETLCTQDLKFQKIKFKIRARLKSSSVLCVCLCRFINAFILVCRWRGSRMYYVCTRSFQGNIFGGNKFASFWMWPSAVAIFIQIQILFFLLSACTTHIPSAPDWLHIQHNRFSAMVTIKSRLCVNFQLTKKTTLVLGEFKSNHLSRNFQRSWGKYW